MKRSELTHILSRYFSPLTAASIVEAVARRSDKNGRGCWDLENNPSCVQEVGKILKLYGLPDGQRTECMELITPSPSSTHALGREEKTAFPIRKEDDVLVIRNHVRKVAERVGFENIDVVKIATAVTEVCRNICRYARHGEVTVTTFEGRAGRIEVRATDNGPGIPHLDQVLAGEYRSRTGLGKGILGSKKLMDDFHIETSNQGTSVTMCKRVTT